MDLIYQDWLHSNFEQGMALANSSDLLTLVPLGHEPFTRYAAWYTCRGLVRTGLSEPTVAERFGVFIQFPHDYLRRANWFEVLSWAMPETAFHPNIAPAGPHNTSLICVGRVKPGELLCTLLERCHEVITFQNVNMFDGDALNRDACAWARNHQHLFPIDPRPLRRRQLDLTIEPVEVTP